MDFTTSNSTPELSPEAANEMYRCTSYYDWTTWFQYKILGNIPGCPHHMTWFTAPFEFKYSSLIPSLSIFSIELFIGRLVVDAIFCIIFIAVIVYGLRSFHWLRDRWSGGPVKRDTVASGTPTDKMRES